MQSALSSRSVRGVNGWWMRHLLLAALELGHHARNVCTRLAIRRNAVILVDRGRTRVIGSECERKVVVVARQQRVEIGRAAVYVLVRLKAVLDAKIARRS